MPVRFPSRLLPTTFATAALTLAAPARPALAQHPVRMGAGHDRDEDGFSDCDHDRGDQVRYCTVRERGFGAVKKLDVEPGENGGVEVVGWDRDSTLVRARVEAHAATETSARALVDQVKIDISGGRIRVSGPHQDDAAPWSVMLEIRVPAHTDVKVATRNGPVRVEGVKGDIRLSALNGPVSLERVAGDVVVRAENGPLTVDLDGLSWAGKGLDAETTNGPLALAIPEGYSAQLETGTVNGPLSVDFPMTVTLGRNGNGRLNATLGKGGPPVRVVTTNGPATIAR